MKKLLLLIPIFLISCVESELYVPGENTGDVDVDTEDPIEVYKLTSYISAYPDANFSILINEKEEITDIGDKEIDSKDGSISKIEKGNLIYTFGYNASGDLESISNNQSQTFLISRTNSQTLSAVLQDDNNQIATYIIELNDNNRISSYVMVDSNGKEISTEFIFSNGNVTNINYNVNSVPEYTLQMSYDNVANPLYKIGERNYNTIMLFNAFENYSGQMPDLSIATLLINKNNRIQEVNSLTPANLIYNYENELPMDAEVKNLTNELLGTVEYIYN